MRTGSIGASWPRAPRAGRDPARRHTAFHANSLRLVMFAGLAFLGIVLAIMLGVAVIGLMLRLRQLTRRHRKPSP